MSQRLWLAAAGLLLAGGAFGQKEAKPAQLADHYRVLFENDEVRVVEFDGKPDTRVGMASRSDRVLYPLKGCDYKVTTADGKTENVRLGQGKVRWEPAGTQSQEIVGERSCDYIQVELKR